MLDPICDIESREVKGQTPPHVAQPNDQSPIVIIIAISPPRERPRCFFSRLLYHMVALTLTETYRPCADDLIHITRSNSLKYA